MQAPSPRRRTLYEPLASGHAHASTLDPKFLQSSWIDWRIKNNANPGTSPKVIVNAPRARPCLTPERTAREQSPKSEPRRIEARQ